jgi:hypothetical protein
MKTFFYAFITLVIVSACSEQKEQILVEVPALHASEMYRGDSVKKYILKYGSENHDIATSYLEKSHAVKDKDLKKAIYFLKRSITLEPTSEAYKELTQLLSEDKNYAEAYSASDVLVRETYYEMNGQSVKEYVFSKPDENTVINYVILSILANNAVDYYSLSVEEIDKQKVRARLITDERFKYDTSNSVHKNIMMQFWTEEEVETYRKSVANLDALLNSVTDTSSVFEINQKNVSQFRYDDFNGINYSDDYMNLTDLKSMAVYYLKEKQEDPDAWIQYNIGHSLHPHDTLNVLVYAIDTSATACPIEMREIYHRLVVYGADGKIISDKIIAFQSGEHLQTVSFNNDHFEISEYKRNWKKPYKKRDFDNEITSTELLSKKMFTISASGEIVESISH